MAFDVNAFVGDILKDVSVDDTQKAALQAVLANPVVAKRVEESTLRQSEASRLFADYKDKIKKAQDYWDQLVEWNKKAKAQLDQDKALLKQKLVDEDIDLNDPNAVKATGVSKEELQQLAKEAVAYQNAVTKLAMTHFKEFGEILDTDEVLKVSAENGGINIHLAYDKYVQPKREELQKADIQKQLEQARKEGAAEALKNVQIPTSESTHMGDLLPQALDALNKKPEERASEYGQMAAVKAWKENRAKGGTVPAW